MKNKTRQYIDNLIQQNDNLKEENARLKQTFLFNCKNENTALMRANLMILELQKALAEEKQKNELLLRLQ